MSFKIHEKREAGFIKYIVIFLVFAGLLVYFGIDVRGFIDAHPEILSFVHDIGDFAVSIWKEYLWPFIGWTWNMITSMTPTLAQ